MTVFLAFLALLLLAHVACARLARRAAGRLMRPADELEAEDVDRWLELIEPFPLGQPRTPRRSGER
jgi:hypothetical protein